MIKTTLNAKLKNTDWQIGIASDFLVLSPEESAMVEIRLALSEAAKKLRIEQDLSQAELAKRMRSSQSRVAKIEASDPSVSIDLMVHAMLAAGAGVRDIGRALTV